MRYTRVLVLLLISVLAAACSGTPTSAPGEHMTGDTMADHMAEGGHDGMHGTGDIVYEPMPGADAVRIHATDFAFSPQRLTLAAGEPVNLTVVNDGQLFHDLTLEGPVELHLNFDVGEEATSSLVIDEPGTYEAVCSVAGHANAGMVLEVEVV
jgi:uncharacterized cupredoxin-like copper-binding protein